jgi:hypothetical protein
MDKICSKVQALQRCAFISAEIDIQADSQAAFQELIFIFRTDKGV